MAKLTNDLQVKEYVEAFVKASGDVKLVITTDEEYDGAIEMVRGIKSQKEEVLDYFKPMKEKAYQAHKEICAHEKEAVKPFEDAEKKIKDAMAVYTELRKAKQLEEADRVKAEAEAEKEKMLEKAKALEAEGKTEEAQDIYDTLKIMENMSVDLAVSADAPLSDAAYTIKNYEIVIEDITKVPDFVGQELIRPVDEAAVKRLIKESKGTIQIPGISYRETLTVCVRK